jgi:hypothetical protein
MKKFTIFVLTLFIAVLSSSCSKRWCNAKYPVIAQTDSVYIETVKKIPVLIPGDTVKIDVPINCPDQELINVETAKLKQVIQILNGKLQSNTLIKPDTVIVTVTNTETVIKEVKVPEPVKFIPKIYKQALSICIVIFSLAFLFIGWKAYRFFKK